MISGFASGNSTQRPIFCQDKLKYMSTFQVSSYCYTHAELISYQRIRPTFSCLVIKKGKNIADQFSVDIQKLSVTNIIRDKVLNYLQFNVKII